VKLCICVVYTGHQSQTEKDTQFMQLLVERVTETADASAPLAELAVFVFKANAPTYKLVQATLETSKVVYM